MMTEPLSSLKRWLHFVDKQLGSEAVELLKLGLHSEFIRFYSEVEELDRPSELYYILLKRCMRGSESRTLKMFVHVVQGLGGSLRGNSVTREAFGEDSTYRMKHPGPLDLKKVSKDFMFFQYLLKISIKADDKIFDQLKKKFSQKSFLNINHRQIKSLPHLFIKLFQEKFIAANNTNYLAEVLYKYQAWDCLQILNKYHKLVDLQPIALAPGMEEYGKALGGCPCN